MKKEDKVISIELAEKLHELGVRVESEWWWSNEYCGPSCRIGKHRLCQGGEYGEQMTEEGECYPAYDTAELGEMLPKNIPISNLPYRWYYFVTGNGSPWFCSYQSTYDINDELWGTHDTKEAEARGKMLVWLIENGYFKAEDL